MPKWSASMQRTYEYFIVDPGTWKDKQILRTVISSNIDRDSEASTLGSATIDVTESTGECYIRIYMVTVQNGLKERHCLGTFLVQTPSSSFNGKIRNISMDAYTPLLELNENQPPLGYYIAKGDNILDVAYKLVGEHARAPVVSTKCDTTLYTDFVADPNDTWLSFISSLLANAKYTLGLDEVGRIIFVPTQDTASLQPVWTYDDSNSSILSPDITMDHDMYGIPNVVEVIYSSSSDNYFAEAINDDPNSPISTVSRGREIRYRVTNPDLVGIPNREQITEYATQLLRNMSTLEYKITYTHGYCPVTIGDCVRFNYTRAGLTDIKAKVISQSIKCTPDCQVTETAVFTKKLWG